MASGWAYFRLIPHSDLSFPVNSLKDVPRVQDSLIVPDDWLEFITLYRI